MKIFNKKTALLFLPAVFLFCLDRYLKFLSLKYFLERDFNLLGDFFKFSFAENKGIAFSLSINQIVLFFLIGIILAALIFYSWKLFLRRDFLNLSFVFLIILGAMSNLYDRIIFGFVIDYFDLMYFTIFNLADVMVFCGVVFLLLMEFWGTKFRDLDI
jgi:signal peptidase II